MARVFDQLAEPEAILSPNPGRQRKGPPRHRRQLVRRWPRRAVLGACILVAVCILSTLGAWAYVTLRVDQIKRVSIPSIATPPPAGQPMNILVVGSDTRSGLPAGSVQHFGSIAQNPGQRSDVIIILHTDPASQQASILSIPRDLFVPIAGSKGSDRINAAFNTGPNQLVETIQQDFGIQINHYVSVNFQGFQQIVDSVGGISMNFPMPARDQVSGLKITSTGCQHLDGAAALALARSRDYQYFSNGRWQYDGTGDLGRIERQHAFLRVLMERAISAGIHNPITANSLIASAVNDVTVDQELSTATIVQLALKFRSLQPSAVPNYTIPTRPVNGYQNFGDVLFPVQPQTQRTVAQFLGRGSVSTPATPALPSPASVATDVFNGSGVGGQAAKAAGDLRAAQFKVGKTGDAANYRYTQSVVLYAPGQEADAQLLQSELVGGASIQQDTSLSGVPVALITGANYSGVRAGANPFRPASSPPAPAPAQYPPLDPTAC